MTWPPERSRDGGIDEIPLPGGPGRLWLCGKHVVGPDPEGALARVGATTIVCLNEAHEIESRYPGYVGWLRANAGTRAVWVPVHDLHAPPLAELRALLAELQARLARGEGVVVHCGAGIGRAGTIAVALLVDMGASLDDASAIVRRARPTAGPEAGAQRELLEALAGGC